MNHTDDLSPEDPLSALLAAYEVTGSDIEQRVLSQLAQEDEHDALRAEVAELRSEVATLRAEMAELRRLLMATRPAAPPLAPALTDPTRGRPLLPYVRNDDFSLLPGGPTERN